MPVDPLVYCRSRTLRSSTNESAAREWLSTNECEEQSSWTNLARRRAWSASRRLGKQLVREVLPDLACEPQQIEILSKNSMGKSVRPRVSVAGKPQPWSFSISHTDEVVFVALSLSPNISIGVDLCQPDRHRDIFADTWFTNSELSYLRGAGSDELWRLWAIKESVYKACNRGEPFAPRRVRIGVSEGRYCCTYHDRFLGDDLTIDCHKAHGHIAVVSTFALTGACHD